MHCSLMVSKWAMGAEVALDRQCGRESQLHRRPVAAVHKASIRLTCHETSLVFQFVRYSFVHVFVGSVTVYLGWLVWVIPAQALDI